MAFGDLTVYTGFDYSGSTLAGESSTNDIGFADSWTSIGVGIAAGNLDYPASSGFTAIGNRISTFSSSEEAGNRLLETSAQIDMDVDRDYYFSFLMSSSSGRYTGVRLLKEGDLGTRLEVGIGSNRDFRVCYGGGCSDNNEKLTTNTTYLIAGIIEARATEQDTISMKAYLPTDTVDSSPPTSWTASRSGDYSGVYTEIQVVGGNNNTWEFDEIRYGESWFDVAYFSNQSYNPYPASGAVGVELTPALAWDASYSEGTTFNVYLGADTDPNSWDELASGLNEKTVSVVVPLDKATTYYWRVDSISGGTVTVGDVWTFTTAGKAAMPQPSDGSGSNGLFPLLEWQGDYLGESYNVYFGTSPETLTVLGETAEPEYAITEILDENSTYYWRVDQLDAAGVPVMSGDVWSFSTGGLFGHWKLDEASGTTVINAVPGGPDGTIVAPNNDYSRTVGVVDGGIQLNPIDQTNDQGPRIELTDIFGSDPNITTDKATIAMWLRPEGSQQSVVGMFINRGSSAAGMQIQNGNLRYMWNNDHWSWDSGIAVPIETWVYVALVIEPTQATYYLVEDGQVSTAVNITNHYGERLDGPTRIGGEVLERTRFFQGMIDDVRIYNRPLNEAEVLAIYDESSLAKNPNPSNGQTNLPTTLDLTWISGAGMISQDLYLRSDPNFAGAVPEEAGITGTVWSVDNLQMNTTYYWRVDTITDLNVHAGNVWSFKTAPPKAYNPTPADNAVEVSPSGTELSWTPAPGGTYTHQVYISTEVSDVVERQPAAYQGEFTDPVFNPAGMLEFEKQYFWAVDEFDGQNLYAGDVWNFTTIIPVCDSPLLSDADGDCVVDMEDFAILTSEWLDCNLIPAEACP